MNTPKREVSWLASFPPDIWAYIVCYLPGEQLGRLMMTGATLLWQRLKATHVVKTVKLGHDFLDFKSFPRFLNDFPSLEELSINSLSHSKDPKYCLKMADIPSGVRKLELSGFSKEVATKLFDDAIGTLNLAKHLPHLEVLDFILVNFVDYRWMAHSPQTLTDLSLNRWDGIVELPSSLVRFCAFEVYLSTDSFVSKLPPPLESFIVLNLLEGLDLLVPLLPPSTRKLSLGRRLEYSDIPRSSRRLFEQLPKSLTSFKVPHSVDIDFETDPELISFLPSTLTELEVLPDFPYEAWSLLPPNLSNLSFGVHLSHFSVVSKIVDAGGVHHEVQSIPFDTLPRSITRLELFWPTKKAKCFCGPPIEAHQSYFPPTLTYLKVSNVQLSREAAKLLPSSLTYLSITNLCEQVCEHLPNSLKTLISSQALMSPNLFKFLPSSLSSLHLSIPSGYGNWFDYRTGDMVMDITELPEYSIHEQCLSQSFDWKHSATLPPTLTYFDLDSARELGDSFLVHHQLPNLLELHLGRSKHISDISIPLLSSQLTTLDLWSSSKVSGKSFKFLSRCLTSLNLRTSESIFDCDIQHLPRTLKRVNLGSAIHLTDLCVTDLPPHLEKLNLECNSHITPSSFPHFPYPIRSPHQFLTAILANWNIQQGSVSQHQPRQRDWSINFP